MKKFTTRHDGFPPLLVAQGSSRGAAAQSDTPAPTSRRLLALFEAVFPMLNPFARIPVCGLISMYNATAMSPGPILLPHMMRAILTKRFADL